MASIPLKPGYGPTLGQILSPLWRRAPTALRALLIALALLLLLLVLALASHLRPHRFGHNGPVSFGFEYKDLSSVTPEARQFVRLVGYRGSRLEYSFTVAPLQLPAYSGHLSGELPLYATGYTARLRARSDDFVLRAEGKAKVNEAPSYSIFYTLRIHGELMYGRSVLLFPQQTTRGSRARHGVQIVALTAPWADPEVDSPLDVASAGVLDRPLHSFEFG